MIQKAIIMCGGWATRFLPASKVVPKELLPLYDTPILEILVKQLIDCNIKEILFIIRQGKESIGRHFSRDISFENQVGTNCEHLKKLNNYQNAKFYFTYQNFQKGTGDALLQARDWVGNLPFFLLNGDEIVSALPSIFQQMIKKFKETKNAIMSLTKIDQSEAEKYGIVEFCNLKNRYITRIVEKPKICDAPSQFANIGTYIFTPDIFDYIIEEDNMPITDAINGYLNKHKMYGLEIVGKRYDLGSPLGFVLSNFDYTLNNPLTRKSTLEYLRSQGFYHKE